MNGKAKGLSDCTAGFTYERGSGSRACFKISRRPAARDFGRGQGGDFRASPQRAVRNEPTPATDKRPAARRVFGQKAAWLRCSSVTDPWRVCSLVAPRHPAFCPKTGPLRILKQALRENLRLSSLILAYSRLSSLNGKKCCGRCARPPQIEDWEMRPKFLNSETDVNTAKPRPNFSQ